MHKTTVRELIEELQKHSPDAIVTTPLDDDNDKFIASIQKMQHACEKTQCRITFEAE